MTEDTNTDSDDKKPSFFAILPANVRYDSLLSSTAKLLYAEISALTNFRGYCYARNSYFCDVFGITDRAIRKLLKELKDRDYIYVEAPEGESRRIYLAIAEGNGEELQLPGGRNKSSGGGEQEFRGGGTSVPAISENMPRNPKPFNELQQKRGGEYTKLITNKNIYLAPERDKKGRERALNLYSLFPRGTAKEKSLELIEQAITANGFDAVEAAVKEYSQATTFWPADQKRYIKTSLRWFQDGHYNDDPESYWKTSRPRAKVEEEQEPAGWREWFVKTYPASDYPNAERYEKGNWLSVPDYLKKEFLTGIR